MYLNKKTTLLFLAILGVGVAVRFIGLDKESLWLDEFYSLSTIQGGVLDVIEAQKGDCHPPLYYILLKFWSSIFGESEWGLRSLSGVIGSVTIVLLFFTARFLFGDPVSLISCLIFSLSPFHIYYSQEARMYSLLVFLTLGCIYFAAKIVSNKSLHYWPGLAFFEIATLYTHNYGLIFVLSLNIYVFYYGLTYVKDRKFLKWWLLVQVIVLAAYGPWIPVLMSQIAAGGASVYATSRLDVSKVGGLLMLFFLKGFPQTHLIGYVRYFIFVSIVLIFLWGIFDFKQTNKEYVFSVSRSKENSLIIFLFIIPIALVFLGGIFIRIYNDRSLIIILVSVCILLGLGIFKMKMKLGIMVIALWILFSSIAIRGLYQNYEKEQWREAAAYVDLNSKPDDMGIVCMGYLANLFKYYCKVNLDIMGIKNRTSKEELIPIVDLAILEHKRLWLILNCDYGSPIREVLFKNKNLIITKYRSFNRVDVYLLDKVT